MNFLQSKKNPLLKQQKQNKIKNPIDAFTITIWVFMVFWCLFFCLILYWALITSFATTSDLLIRPGRIPKNPQWENYLKAFDQVAMNVSVKGGGSRVAEFPELLFNTFMYAVVTPFLCLITSCTAAYVVCKYSKKVKFVFFFFSLTIFCTYMPISGSIASTLKWQRAFGLYDTFLGVWIHESGAFGSMFLLYYATFKGVSNEYMEAAQIDGAGHWRIFLQVVMPQTMGVFWALYIKLLVELWNEYKTPLMYLPSHPTIALASWTMQNTSEVNFPTILAGLVIVITPIMIVFIIFRDKLLNAEFTLAGLKG